MIPLLPQSGDISQTVTVVKLVVIEYRFPRVIGINIRSKKREFEFSEVLSEILKLSPNRAGHRWEYHPHLV